MAAKNVPSDEWVEVVPETLEDDYSIVVRDAPIYLAVGSKPTQAVAGLPIQDGAIQSGTVDRLNAIYARSQTDVDATVRVVPGIRIDGSNERAVSVSTSVRTDTYEDGASFDTADGATYPITLDPAETIEHVLLSIVGGEVDVEITTTAGDVITLPVDSKSSIDSYSADKVVIKDGGTTPRVAGGWAGE